MYNYDNEYSQPNFESDFEFNYEQESDFENEDYEYDQEQDYEQEADYEDEVTVHDHRTPRVSRPAAPRPAGTISPLNSVFGGSRPATPGTYNRPGYYSRRPAAPVRTWNNSTRSWTTVPAPRPSFGAPYRPPYRPWTGYRNPLHNRVGMPWYNRHRSPWYNRPGAPVYNSYGSPLYNQGMPGSVDMQAGSSLTGQSTAAPADNAVLESIRSLAQQIASTNANLASLQRSMAESAGAQQQGPPPGADAMSAAGAAPSSEYEMGDYEYDMESDAMNYEQENSNEQFEMELAAELLNVNNESELDHFLGGLLKKLTGGLSKAGGLGSLLKVLAPVAATAFLGPAGGIAAKALTGEVFGLEMEGLSLEDQEFETARAFIRLASDAAKELEANPPSADPDADAKNALIQSATMHAPGLLVRKRRNSQPGQRGRWHRRGNKIIIENAF